jgi:pimeloyl-ACP methyl ester carboxylesterase
MGDLRVKVGDIELQVRHYKRAADAVIFLHFSGSNLMMWQKAISYFQDRFQLILIDLRDHGKSDKPQAGDNIDQMARDVVAVMEHLKIENAYIVGSSLGAEVGLALAANYPEKVILLVCEGSVCSEFGPFSTWEGSEAEYNTFVDQTLTEMRSKPEPVFSSIQALVESRKQVFEKFGWWNSYFEALYQYDAFQVCEGQFTFGYQKLAKENYFESYFKCRFEDYYRRVKCPVLILLGDDEWQSEETRVVMQNLLDLTPDGRIAAVPGWVHPYGWMLEPEGISKTITAFFARQ